jgi:formate hydrogenlyase subunit 6/NADH:ubiquinone oxidoreductase subunit I
MAVFKMAKVLLNRLFQKPATLMYPVVPREWTARTRGHIDIDVDQCIKCGICARKCPTNAITVDRDASTWEIQRMQCIQCGCCAEVCPKKCLTMAPEYTTPNVVKVIDTFEIPVKEKAAAKAGGGEEKLKCNTDDCVFCGLCAKTCPAGALEVNRDEKTWKVDEDACVKCGACVDKCPKKCLEISADGAAAPAASDEDGLSCNVDECVYCGLCAKTCPVEAITVDRGEKKWEVDKDTCVQCGACVDKCPKKCLSL